LYKIVIAVRDVVAVPDNTNNAEITSILLTVVDKEIICPQ